MLAQQIDKKREGMEPVGAQNPQKRTRTNHSTTHTRCVALDLDETTGSWGLGSLAYQVWTALGQRSESLVRPFVEHYMAAGGARPYLRELLCKLRKLVDQDRIDKVAIFTSASNLNGWVDFLKRCMEEYAHTPGLFGQCLCREDAVEHARTSGGVRTVKDLSLLSSNANQVVLLDDKPCHAINGYVIAVPEYDQSVNAADLVQWMKAQLPEHAEQIDNTFQKDSINHPSDKALDGCIQVLMQLFPAPEGCNSFPEPEGRNSFPEPEDCNPMRICASRHTYTDEATSSQKVDIRVTPNSETEARLKEALAEIAKLRAQIAELESDLEAAKDEYFKATCVFRIESPFDTKGNRNGNGPMDVTTEQVEGALKDLASFKFALAMAKAEKTRLANQIQEQANKIQEQANKIQEQANKIQEQANQIQELKSNLSSLKRNRNEYETPEERSDSEDDEEFRKQVAEKNKRLLENKKRERTRTHRSKTRNHTRTNHSKTRNRNRTWDNDVVQGLMEPSSIRI